MTSIEVPYSIAAALPTLSVMDITNDVSKSVAQADRMDGIAYISATSSLSLVRVQERETGFFEDLECLLERIVPGDTPARERLVHGRRPRGQANRAHQRRHLPAVLNRPAEPARDVLG